MTMRPFSDILQLITSMPDLDVKAAETHDKRCASLYKTEKLMSFTSLSRHLSYSQGRYPPQIVSPEIALFVGSHGIEAQYPQEEEMLPLVEALQKGDTPLNQLCGQNNISLKVFEVGLGLPTEDITSEMAMNEKEVSATIAYGMEALAGQSDLLVLSSIGSVGNFVATILASHFFEYPTEKWIVEEDFISKEVYQQSMALMKKTRQYHSGDHSPLEALKRMGSREIAACIGAIIAARHQKTPIILDSLPALVAALVVHTLQEGAIDHCLLGHMAASTAFKIIAEHLDMRPILDLDLPAEGGIGGTSAIHIIRDALYVHNYTKHIE